MGLGTQLVPREREPMGGAPPAPHSMLAAGNEHGNLQFLVESPE